MDAMTDAKGKNFVAWFCDQCADEAVKRPARLCKVCQPDTVGQ